MQALAFWIGYLAVSGAAVAGVVIATRRLGSRPSRHLLIASVLAMFVSPSFVIRGHGIGPAWMAALDADSISELLLYAVLPFVATWIVIFGVMQAVVRLSRGSKG
jgi:hypothetical protein